MPRTRHHAVGGSIRRVATSADAPGERSRLKSQDRSVRSRNTLAPAGGSTMNPPPLSVQITCCASWTSTLSPGFVPPGAGATRADAASPMPPVSVRVVLAAACRKTGRGERNECQRQSCKASGWRFMLAAPVLTASAPCRRGHCAGSAAGWCRRTARTNARRRRSRRRRRSILTSRRPPGCGHRGPRRRLVHVRDLDGAGGAVACVRSSALTACASRRHVL